MSYYYAKRHSVNSETGHLVVVPLYWDSDILSTTSSSELKNSSHLEAIYLWVSRRKSHTFASLSSHQTSTPPGETPRSWLRVCRRGRPLKPVKAHLQLHNTNTLFTYYPLHSEHQQHWYYAMATLFIHYVFL